MSHQNNWAPTVSYGTEASLIFDLLRQGEIAAREGGTGGTGGGLVAGLFTSRFWQISKPYLNQGDKICPHITTPPLRFSDLPPSLAGKYDS